MDGPSRSRAAAGYRFENCIVATGSVPAMPPSLNLASPRVMDSTGALKLEDVPPRLLVVGGGYIGLEMGYVYAALGSKVTVVELTDGLLPGVDRDLVRPLHKRLEKLFDKIYLKTKVAQAGRDAEGHPGDAGRRGSRRQAADLRARAGGGRPAAEQPRPRPGKGRRRDRRQGLRQGR